MASPQSTTALPDLIFDNYRANRERSPEISPERWGAVYGATAVNEMEARYRTTITLRKVALPQWNDAVLCEAVDVTTSGQDNLPPCGNATRRCPGCGEWSDFCEDHLFEQPDGTRVCVECDGNPEFRLEASR